MNLKALIKRILRPAADRFLGSIAARIGSKLQLEASREFDLHHFLALRTLAGRGDHHVVLPYDSARSQRQLKDLKIGFFGNIANNAYNFVRCLRRLGYQAELVIEDSLFDAFLMNRPFWEDLEVSCESYDEGLGHEHGWVQPHYLRRVAYDPEMQARFQGRYSAIPEVQGLYKQAFRVDLPPDAAFVLAQQMGHWPYLLAMGRYDLVQFSGAPISMGLFCPKPYVVFPTGSDLFISPFEETPLGMLMRSGYRRARHVLACETNYPEYLERLGLSVPYTFTPLMIDTETYVPGKGDDLRAQWWMKAGGGTRFILSVCRQSWDWKGNDRLIRAFQSFVALPGNQDWRLVLMEWGPDVARTKALIEELGLGRLVVWQKLASKPLLRKCQQAADVVVDQFVMAGYGTSVLESMAAGRLVIMRAPDGQASRYFPELPPFLAASQPEEVCARLQEASRDQVRNKVEAASIEWLRRYHGYGSVAKLYLHAYRAALQQTMTVT